MKVEILIVSHLKDKPYLEYCLRSIAKFATGFSAVALVVPKDELNDFLPLAVTFELRLLGHDLPGHLGAQAQKCMADLHCSEAEFILHTDSDCVFTEPVTPEDYFLTGKPVMLIEEFSRLPGNPWQKEVERALGHPVQYETMRRHPQVNPRGIYAAMRQKIATVHRKAFVEYVMAQKADFPWGFTEHCTIGAFALAHPGWKAQYRFIDVGREPRPKDKLAQFWSRSPPDKDQDLPSGGRGLPMELFQRLGL